jgi:hypothetical protein
MAIGFLGMLGIVLLASSGILHSDERTLFTAVGVVVFLLVVATLASLASAESQEKCIFEE